ncbi:type II toxin-antitoxin system mRNA interferase toxin, RelE/StbE family [Candidatus Gracilibacteria bacterium]|nr:type II toxin-antitoxin system mRNA interferase toxin, RelE/StbE family [Candidatus Gracilibacteria bacterium]
MDLRTSKKFNRKFKELDSDQKDFVLDVLDFFREDPHHPSLRNHPLSGSMAGKRSISAGDDCRIIFVEKNNYIQVLMLDIGTHDEVYFD